MLHQKKVTQAEIIDALNSGATVVTANKRLAGVTRQIFEKANIDKGLEVWSTPNILPWTAWLQNTWEEAVLSGILPAPKLLLTQQQELYIWKDIITEAFVDNPLQQVSGTARQAQQAWQLLQAWQLKLDMATFSYNSDSAAFKQWASAFELLCRDNNWLSMARLIDKLQSCAQQGKLAVPDKLVLSGFDELTPQQQSFLQTLDESGCVVSWLQLAGLQSKTVRVACNDARHEAETAARWVRQCIDENPKATIGIVVPELQSQRNIIMQIFDKVLLPQSLSATGSATGHCVARPYNVSLGLPLSSYPIIDTALRLPGLLAPTISLQDAGMLLRSPFIRGWQQEASARSLLDACLRKKVGELEISLKTLRVYANQKDKPHACPELVKNIDAWIEVANTCRHKDGPGQWSEKLATLLTAFGWACGRALSSEEYQATEAWRDLLISFASLDAVTESMTASVAVSQLRSMAKDRTYQAQTGDLPIQLLGVLEADEQQFDYLWVMGLHDGVWPSPPRANPFIPLFIQRDAGLPHSSEDRELQVAREATQRWLLSAGEVIVSYPKRNGDEELRASSLIKNVGEVELETLKLYQALSWSEQVHQCANLEALELDPAPPLEGEGAKGGSSILTHQANCPFRAFAELRLGARALESADIGLNAMVKGSLIHTILENVWQRLESQENLLAMEPSNLKILVEGLTNETIAAIAWRFPQTFTERFRRLESERLCLRVMQWLDLEKQRSPFNVIEMEDRDKYEANAGGVKIKVIIDRIDELEDGRKLVIDYKTGSVAPAQWFGERPEAPQLPLYSMVVEGNVAAVVFAQIKAGDMAFKGVAEEGGLLPAVKSYEQLKYTNKETWAEVLEEWQQTMEKLGAAYRNGDAAIDPKNKSTTCENTYCDLKSLCRINELTTLDGLSAEREEQR